MQKTLSAQIHSLPRGEGRRGVGGGAADLKVKIGPLTPPYLGQLKCRSDKLGVSKASGAKTQLHA